MESPPVHRRMPGAFSTPDITPPVPRDRKTTFQGSPVAATFERSQFSRESTTMWSLASFLVLLCSFLYRILSAVFRLARSSNYTKATRRNDKISSHNLSPPRFNPARFGFSGSRLDFVSRKRSNSFNAADPFTEVEDNSHRNFLLSETLDRARLRGANALELEWIALRFPLFYRNYTIFDDKEKRALQRDVDADANDGKCHRFFDTAETLAEESRRRLEWDAEDDEGYESEDPICPKNSVWCICPKPHIDTYTPSGELKVQLDTEIARQQAAEAAAEAAARAAAEAEAAERLRHRRKLSEERLKARLEAEAKEEEANTIKRRALNGKLIGLPAHNHLTKIADAMAKPNSAPLCKPAGGDTITRYNLEKLMNPTGWLDDVVIMSYLNVVTQLVNKIAGKLGRGIIPKVITLDSLLYDKWDKASSQQDLAKIPNGLVRRAYLGKDATKLFEIETILIPVNSKAHWTLLVISPKERKIEYIDSFRSSGRHQVALARRFLESFLGPAYNPKEWVDITTNSPRQSNGYDCGVFVCTNGECIASGVKLECYDERDLQNQRRRIAAVLLNEGFSDDLVPAILR